MNDSMTIQQLEDALRINTAKQEMLTRFDWAIADRKDIQQLVHDLTVEASGEMASLEVQLRQARDAAAEQVHYSETQQLLLLDLAFATEQALEMERRYKKYAAANETMTPEGHVLVGLLHDYRLARSNKMSAAIEAGIVMEDVFAAMKYYG